METLELPLLIEMYWPCWRVSPSLHEWFGCPQNLADVTVSGLCYIQAERKSLTNCSTGSSLSNHAYFQASSLHYQIQIIHNKELLYTCIVFEVKK